MANKIFELINKNKKIIENLSYLTIIQIISMLLPFITYPYLIKVLGLSLYGKVMLSQAIVSYVAIIVNFGFNISATKSVSEHLSDKDKTNEICSAIFCAKTILWIAATACYLLIVFLFVNDNMDKILYLTAYTLTFNEYLVCQWFFQAKEELKIIAVLSVVSKILNVFLIFAFIHNASDYIYVSLLTGCCYLFTGAYCTFLMFTRHVSLVKPKLSSIVSVTKDSLNLFLTSAIISIKNKLDVVLIGAFMSSEYVALYDFAQKILNLALMPVTIINNSVFAKMTKSKDMLFLKKVVLFSFFFTLAYVTLAQPLIPFIAKLLFVANEQSIFLTRVMLISVVIFSISLPLAQNGLIVFGYTSLHLLGMISTTLVYLCVIGIGYYLGCLVQLHFFLYTSLAIYLYEMSYRLLLCRWKKII